MKSKLVGSLLGMVGLALVAGSALAEDDWGAIYSKAGDQSRVSVPGVDKDGDGCLSKSEVTPGGQLDKRFATRDSNGDGKICKDEYYMP